MTPEKQKEFREFISKYMTQPMLGNKPGTRPDGFISEDDVINKIEAYKNEEVEKAIREERIETVKALKKAVARWNDFNDYGTLEEYIKTIIKVLSPIS